MGTDPHDASQYPGLPTPDSFMPRVADGVDRCSNTLVGCDLPHGKAIEQLGVLDGDLGCQLETWHGH
jgi:hypothetical protein